MTAKSRTSRLQPSALILPRRSTAQAVLPLGPLPSTPHLDAAAYAAALAALARLLLQAAGVDVVHAVEAEADDDT